MRRRRPACALWTPRPLLRLGSEDSQQYPGARAAPVDADATVTELMVPRRQRLRCGMPPAILWPHINASSNVGYLRFGLHPCLSRGSRHSHSGVFVLTMLVVLPGTFVFPRPTVTLLSLTLTLLCASAARDCPPERTTARLATSSPAHCRIEMPWRRSARKRRE
jgi:hypothetical protein